MTPGNPSERSMANSLHSDYLKFLLSINESSHMILSLTRTGHNGPQDGSSILLQCCLL